MSESRVHHELRAGKQELRKSLRALSLAEKVEQARGNFVLPDRFPLIERIERTD